MVVSGRGNSHITRWWFQTCFIFTIKTLQKMIQFDERAYFSNGLVKNHQPRRSHRSCFRLMPAGPGYRIDESKASGKRVSSRLAGIGEGRFLNSQPFFWKRTLLWRVNLLIYIDFFSFSFFGVLVWLVLVDLGLTFVWILAVLG